MEFLLEFIKGLGYWIKIAYISKLTLLLILRLLNKISVKEFYGFALAFPIGLIALSVLSNTENAYTGTVGCIEHNPFVVSCNNWVAMNSDVSKNFLQFERWANAQQHNASFAFSALVVLVIAYAEYGKNILSRNLDDTIRTFVLACTVMTIFTYSGFLMKGFNSIYEGFLTVFGVNPADIISEAAGKIQDYYTFLIKEESIRAMKGTLEKINEEIDTGKSFYVNFSTTLLYFLSLLNFGFLFLQTVIIMFLSTFTLFSYFSGHFSAKMPLSIILTAALYTPMSYGFIFFLTLLPDLSKIEDADKYTALASFFAIVAILFVLKGIISALIGHTLYKIFVGGRNNA